MNDRRNVGDSMWRGAEDNITAALRSVWNEVSNGRVVDYVWEIMGNREREGRDDVRNTVEAAVKEEMRGHT